MPILKQRLSKKTKIQIALVVTAIFVLTVLLALDVFLGGPITTFLDHKDDVITRIESFGFFAPLAFVVLSTIETVVAPIPGQVVGLIGGFLFGWWGLLLNFIATAIGSFIIFYLSRRFGRPLVEKMIKKESLDKFDYLTEQKGSFVFFLIFIIPGLPDDIICFIAGLTEIPIKKLMILVLLGRFPAMIMTNYIGSGLGEDDATPVVIASVITVVILATIIVKRDKILSIINGGKPKNSA